MYTWDIYAAAGLNNLSKGIKVGNVSINYTGGTLAWEITLGSPYMLQDGEHKGRTTVQTVAPGQYPYRGSVGSVSGLSDRVYVIVYAVVGIPCEPTS